MLKKGVQFIYIWGRGAELWITLYKYTYLLNLDPENPHEDDDVVCGITTTSINTSNPDKPPTQYAEVSEYSGNIPVTSGVSGHEYQYIELADRTVNQPSSQVRN